jgi:H+/gluconate symporter-like permease
MALLIIALGIALQVFLTYKKVSPFLSLLVVAIIVGLLLGMNPITLLGSIERGVASTLGSLALIICLGAILGKFLERSGAIGQITSNMIRAFGERHVQWAVLLTGFLVGLPLYYNAGFVILVPLNEDIIPDNPLIVFAQVSEYLFRFRAARLMLQQRVRGLAFHVGLACQDKDLDGLRFRAD